MRKTIAPERIAERKQRDREVRRAQIISAARRIAEAEGWPSVTVRRLADEISYSQPVLYSHFESREAILTAVAVEGFQELGRALERARLRDKRENPMRSIADAYLEFAASSPALYEAMFSLGLSVPFGEAATPPELRMAFSQLMELFLDGSSRTGLMAELFWAGLHGIAELTRTRRLPPGGHKKRVQVLVELYSCPRGKRRAEGRKPHDVASSGAQ